TTASRACRTRRTRLSPSRWSTWPTRGRRYRSRAWWRCGPGRTSSGRSPRAGERRAEMAEDMGPPVAYLGLREGTPVYDRDGERIGVVEHVLADEPMDIFLGLVVHTHPLPGRTLSAVAVEIAEKTEKDVVYAVARAISQDT